MLPYKKAEGINRGKSADSPETETAHLLKDIHRSDMEKLRLFVQMLRRNALYKKAKITHK
jgi:hypothetical protein